MADSPINGFSTTATDVSPGSFFGFDRWNGAAFETVKILGSDLASTLGAPNMANGDRTLTGNRTHSGGNKRWSLTKLKDFTLETSSAPTLGLASFNLSASGNTASDITHRFSSAAGTIAEMYGDRSAKFNGSVGVAVTPSAIDRMAIDAGGKVIALNVTGANIGILANADTGISGLGATFGVKGACNTVQGVRGETQSGAGVAGVAATTGTGVRGESSTGMAGDFKGGVFVEGAGGSASIHASAILHADSTTRGFLPPRMTAAQRTAISSPAIGLMVYQTDATEGVYVNTSGGWVQL